MRILGEGTSHLINRAQEADVYQAIKESHICDDIVYINPKNGYKITEFIEGARMSMSLIVFHVYGVYYTAALSD